MRNVFNALFAVIFGLLSLFPLTAASQAAPEPAVKIAVAQSSPASCAGFVGAFTGDWKFGTRMLWVRAVDEKCVAKYTYGSPRTALKSADIVDGVLAIPCGISGGTCSFTVHGDELWGRYGGNDGTNNAVFKKIPTPAMGQ